MEGGLNGQHRALTIGHSNHPMERLIELLHQFSVEVVVDTRSLPRSQFAPHFDLEPLKKALREAGLRYAYLGRELGGRPRGEEFYDEAGHVLYSKVAESALFEKGIARLLDGIKAFRVALLCSEEDPRNCHRRLLIGRVLGELGVAIDHIRADGTLQSEAEIEAIEQRSQLALFPESEATEWKSIPSVSPKRRQSSFSAF